MKKCKNAKVQGGIKVVGGVVIFLYWPQVSVDLIVLKKIWVSMAMQDLG